MSSTAALIPAAGSGTRLGLGAKAFVEVAGKSLLVRSIAALRPHVDEVVVALPAGMGPDSAGLDMAGVRVITGGDTRQSSVRRLLEATNAHTVLIHDAARPFLSAAVIQALLKAVSQTGAATTALPVADTLVRAQAGAHTWREVVAREGLWAVQTPQVFERTLILQAHLQAQQQGYTATDDAGLVARLGHTVALVQGDARLFKITTPSDLLLAQAVAATWDSQP